ncbi:hypothetical protein HY798_02825 [Candidatus Falkowbacteria bacterium]|nr:hypothetical protein [Candidatus Falkowbacteria bacterium]
MIKSKWRLALIIIIIFFTILFLASRGQVYDKNELEYGVTFSKKQAVGLGLDWQKVYLAVLDELGVKRLRLAAYWNEVEPVDGDYFWSDLDWQIKEAGARKAEIILALGGRLPRWPECHWPAWAAAMDKEKREQEILNYIQETIERYKSNSQVTTWQIENEPFLAHFGDCPKLDKEFLDKEIALARKLDSRPIAITDSGELSIWIPAAKRADIFGTTMYRDTYSQHLKMYIHYPIGPGFFRLKKKITSFFAHPKKWIVIELAAEPWTKKYLKDSTQEERDRTMNPKKFKEILEFARQTGFKEFYLWGAEWWYWEREQGRSTIWEEAKKLF